MKILVEVDIDPEKLTEEVSKCPEMVQNYILFLSNQVEAYKKAKNKWKKLVYEYTKTPWTPKDEL